MADETGAASEAAKSVFGEGAPAPETPPETTEAPEWAIAKHWVGDGKDYAERVTASYAALEKAFHAKGGDAGDPHDDDIAKYQALVTEEALSGFDRIPAEERGHELLLEAVKAAGLGPRKANEIVQHWLKGRNDAAPVPETDEARKSRVIHEMGPSGAVRATEVATWIGAQAKDGSLTADEIKAMVPLAGSAAGMTVLWKLSRAGGGGPPSAEQHAADQAALRQDRAEKVQSIREKMADPTVYQSPSRLAALQEEFNALTKGGAVRLDGSPPGRGRRPGEPGMAM